MPRQSAGLLMRREMGKVEITIKIDEKFLEKITGIGLDISEYLEKAGRHQYEKMQGGPIKDDE